MLSLKRPNGEKWLQIKHTQTEGRWVVPSSDRPRHAGYICTSLQRVEMKKDIDFSKKLSPIPKEDESLVGNVSFNVLFHVRSEGKNNKAWAQWMNLIKRTTENQTLNCRCFFSYGHLCTFLLSFLKQTLASLSINVQLYIQYTWIIRHLIFLTWKIMNTCGGNDILNTLQVMSYIMHFMNSTLLHYYSKLQWQKLHCVHDKT